MTTSLTQADIQTSELKSVFSRLLDRRVTTIERIGGGRNSQVYRVTGENSNSAQYTVKLYFHHKADDRDRLGVEFSSLQFLWENGVRAIPQPILADRACGCAVYEYIEGQKITSSEVTASDIDEAVQFLTRLKELKNRKGSKHLPLASEACFSIQSIVNNIERRLKRLSTLDKSGSQYEALHHFLANEFIPSFYDITKWCQSSLYQSGMSFEAEFPYEERTLSPSDFGFHNVLRRNEGKIVFLDFEYFGWDDPAKTISDFLLHPAMKLKEGLKQQFVTSILRECEEYRHLAKRVEIVYPLFALKWCMIFLNEFVPEHLARRGFASKSAFNKHNLQTKQLSKAKQMLARIKSEYENFPYHYN